MCAKIESRVGKEDTRFRPAVDTPRRLAIFLEFLATGPTYNTLAEHCGVSRTNVFDIIEDVADAIIAVLKGDMRFPSDPTTIKDLEMGFRELWGLPGACGAIDGSHFPIMKPSENGDDNLNRKKYPSVAGLFVASSECYCLDMVVGWPGSTHDSRMWRNMSLRGRMLDGDVPLRTMPPVQVNFCTDMSTSFLFTSKFWFIFSICCSESALAAYLFLFHLCCSLEVSRCLTSSWLIPDSLFRNF